MLGELRTPLVVVVALEDELRTLVVLDGHERTGADERERIGAAVAVVELLEGSERKDGVVGVGQLLQDVRRGLGERELPGRLVDRLRGRVPARGAQRAALRDEPGEAGLHRVGAQCLAVVERHVIAQRERPHRAVVVRLPLGREPGVELALVVLPDERIDDLADHVVVREVLVGGRVEAGGLQIAEVDESR